MKIGIDLRTIENDGQHRGIGRYAINVLQSLSEIDDYNQYFFILSSPNAKPPIINLNKKFSFSYLYGKKSLLRNKKYIRILFPLHKPLKVDDFDIDVFLHIDPSKRIKIGSKPVVSLAHDFIPFIFKEQYQKVHLGGYSLGHLIGFLRMKLHWSVSYKELRLYKKCTRIIAISNHTKSDLLKHVNGVDPKKITVVLLAANKIYSSNDDILKHVQNLNNKKFLFYVGGADPRKGLVEFTNSLPLLWENNSNVNIVFSGKEITDKNVPEAVRLHKTAKRLDLKNRINFFGFVSDAELNWLYKNAIAFVFPSRYEGFGLPVLEAMQAGCPVVAYNNSSIPEVAGDAAILVEDGESMVPAIEKILENPALRKDLINKGKKRASKFSWEKTARETLSVLEQAAKD